MKIWEPKPPGTLWATPDLLRDTFTFTPAFFKMKNVVLRGLSKETVAYAFRVIKED
jgi:hypothetical protein